ncbi:MAG TPA: condensation domain-containing protein, partial [Pyrinomonadaceae bacterium]
SIREATVTTVEDDSGDKHLAGYLVARPEQVINVSELRGYLRERLPGYMIPALFVMLAELPRLPNGKVDHNRLPAPGGERPELTDKFAPARNAEEELLVGIWSQVLKVEKVGINDNFFELGGHSLLVTRIISRMRKAFNLDVPARLLFENPTVASLAESLRGLRRARQGVRVPPLLPRSREKASPLSFQQQRLWFLDQLQPGLAAYNLISAVALKGRLDLDALERTLNEIVRRHESLRTTFILTEGQPAQLIHEPQPLELPAVDLRQASEEERRERARQLAAEAARQPFDLSRGPLVRALLLRLAEDEHWFVMVLHHIVSDGWSTGVLIREMAALYTSYSGGQESPLAELTIQYADYAAWQREWMQGQALARQLEYWREHLKGAPALLELKTDKPRPAVQSHRGARQTFALTTELTGALKALSLQEEATLFMTLLAAFEIVLHYFSNQEDIVVGSPVANRNMVETEGLIGLFANTLVFRVDLSGNPSFRELLHRVREVAIEAYAHQDVPLEKLVDELRIERNLSHLPLFQVMLVLQNIPLPGVNLPALSMDPIALNSGTVQCDLLLNVRDTEEALGGALEYSTDLFEPVTIARMLGHYELLLQKISEQPDARLKDLRALLADAETKRQSVEEEELLKVAAQKFKSIRRRTVRGLETGTGLG